MSEKIRAKDACILSEQSREIADLDSNLESNDTNSLAFLLFIFFAFLEAAFVVIYAAYYDSSVYISFLFDTFYDSDWLLSIVE
ncbi:hypothetical protein [Cysteiniphilum marinum]|uniref:hypothetical protein n=1 Tax=Cysteiniphilum marinum TaxID=2774191 RepID=UPI00193ABFD9|nr:hypothetical protein [Cysteiniphilum marinum]